MNGHIETDTDAEWDGERDRERYWAEKPNRNGRTMWIFSRQINTSHVIVNSFVWSRIVCRQISVTDRLSYTSQDSGVFPSTSGHPGNETVIQSILYGNCWPLHGACPWLKKVVYNTGAVTKDECITPHWLTTEHRWSTTLSLPSNWRRGSAASAN